MTNRVTAPAWTDDEMGFMLDNMLRPARWVANELGRSVQSIYTKRLRIREGVIPSISAWSVDEDQIIIDGGKYSTVAGLADKLPGRTAEAIATRRLRLGVGTVNSNHKRADVIGGRPLIAKTCPRCGLLLASEWFPWIKSQRVWSVNCKKCRSSMTMNQRGSKSFDARARTSAEKAFIRMQQISIANADRNGEPYLESDHEVLRDPDLTMLQKALRLGRSYAAVRGVCSKNGYKSHVGLGDAERDQWRIDNPNAKEYAA